MNKYFLVDDVDQLKKFVINQYGNVGYLKTRFSYPREFFDSVRANKLFKDIHKGKRCFIIGNGPSLKSQDLSPLKNEIVFTVNQAARNEELVKINPNYHFWIDPVFFNLDKTKQEDLEVLQSFKAIYTDENQPITFLPQHAFTFTKEFNLDKEIDIRFFVQKRILKNKFKGDFDFSKYIPCFGTVVHSCIAMAFYMGFSEIYLLGCDSTGIVSMINSALDTGEAQYAYDISENENKRMHTMYSDEEFLKTSITGFVELLDTYKKFADYASYKGVQIYNCSAETIIRSIPRKKYESLFTENKL